MHQFLLDHAISLLTFAVSLMHVLGVVSAVEALYLARSSQAAIAWGISLAIFPYGALPIYWIFGRARFHAYEALLKRFVSANTTALRIQREKYSQYYSPTVPLDPLVERALEVIAEGEFTGHNKVELLIDGEATFDAIFDALRAAKRYIFIETYIIRSDQLGRRFRDVLIEQARAGVRIHLIFDGLGSSWLPSEYITELEQAGVCVGRFSTRKSWQDFFQLNFRNHRKIVLVDGLVAFVGGHNIGDEYLGRSRRFGHWRDTHVRIEGPAAIAIQHAFLADWYWVSKEPPDLKWIPPPQCGSTRVLPIATGPADERDRCVLLFNEAIRSARKRLWIATPYFVPDDSIVAALELAALRGVDVRIVLPKNPDHLLVWLAAFTYIPQVIQHGVRIFRYRDGFMHQKVLLVDEELSFVGTANLDNRSMRLNFELTVVVADRAFNAEVARMLEADFLKCDEEKLRAFSELPLRIRLGAKFSRLFAPVL